MTLKYFPLAYESFFNKKLRDHSNTFIIIKAFVTALSLSVFIFFNYFGISNFILHTIFVFFGFLLLFKSTKLGYFFTGFFLALFWFYWISFSFRFYELSWMIPFVILGVALICGILFFIPSIITTLVPLRAFILLAFSFYLPFFGFNWLDFGLIFYYTPFGVTSLHISSFVAGIIILQTFKGKLKLLSIIFFILALDFSIKAAPQSLPFEIKIVNTKIFQGDKWKASQVNDIINSNFNEIEKAIDEGKRIIILPETAFPLYLNKETYLQKTLLEYSEKIAIIAGSLAFENNATYNSAYFFDKGVMQRADKVILVPFGESIPLPKFLARPLNKLVFGTEDNFINAQNVTDFIVDNIKIRSAICFEGSRNELFVGDFSYMSVISNNSWFLPSSEPILQNLMLSLYATRGNKIIFHSVNGEGGGVIKPRETFLQNFIKLYL